MVPSATPVSSRRLPAKNVTGPIQTSFYEQLFLRSNFQKSDDLEEAVPPWRGVCHFFCRSCAPFFFSFYWETLTVWIPCLFFKYWDHGGGVFGCRGEEVNTKYRVVLFMFSLPKMSHVSGENVRWLMTGPVLLQSLLFRLHRHRTVRGRGEDGQWLVLSALMWAEILSEEKKKRASVELIY